MNNITFNELRRFGYHHPELIKKYKDAELTKQANALRYIDHLASMTKTEISELQIAPFVNPNGNMVVDKTQINQIFFKIKESLNSTDAPKQTIPREKLLDLELRVKRQLEMNKISVHRKLEMKIRELRRSNALSRALSGDVMELHASNEGLAKLVKDGINIGQLLENTLAQGFWRFHGAAGALIIMHSPPVHLSKFDSRQGVNTTVNMGSYKCELRLGHNGFQAKVYGLEDNVPIGGCIHPHVNGTNEICFGDLKWRAEEAGAMLDLYTLLTHVRDVLQNYTESDCYVHLHDFQRERERPGHIQATLAARTPEDLGIDTESELEDWEEEELENQDNEASEEAPDEPEF